MENNQEESLDSFIQGKTAEMEEKLRKECIKFCDFFLENTKLPSKPEIKKPSSTTSFVVVDDVSYNTYTESGDRNTSVGYDPF